MFLIVWVVRRLVVIAVLLVIVLVVGDLVAGKLVGSAVRSAIAARFGGSPQVSFGSTPLLWQLVHGDLDHVTVREGDASIAGLPPTSLVANFDDVRVTSLIGLHGVVGSVALEAILGPAAVRDLLATSACVGGLPDGVGAALTSDPRIVIPGGHVSLFPPHGRAVELRLAPVVGDRALAFRLIGFAQDGQSASSATVDALAAQADCSRSLAGLPYNLALATASAVPGDVELSFRGRGGQFQE